MATIACPGCGLPRAAGEEDQPCPVCEAGVHDLPAERKADDTPHPHAHLPADTSQLAAAADHTLPGHRPGVVAGVFGFAAGAVAVLAVQGLLPSPPPAAPPPVAVAPADPRPAPADPVDPPAPPPPAARVEVAPPPRQAADGPPVVAVAPAPPAPPAAKPDLYIEVNRPDGSISLPTTATGKEDRLIVVRGRVKGLTVNGVGDGTTLDASGLVADRVNFTGVVGGKSVVRVCAPNGHVGCYKDFRVEGGSRVVVDAPGGEVDWKYLGNRIEGGARVEVAAARVVLGGDVAGAGTRVEVTLSSGGTIKGAGVRGGAAVVYRKAKPTDAAPHVDLPEFDKGTVRRGE